MHPTFSHATRARFALTPVAVVALAMLQAPALRAQSLPQQAPDEAAPVLKPSPKLGESIPQANRQQLPTFIWGDRLSGRTELDAQVDGHAELRRGDTVIRADRLEYYQPGDLARARGNVRVNHAGDIFEGPLLELKVDAFEGFFSEPGYRLLRNGAHGQADRVDFIDDKRAVVRNASYTTCKREPGPSWLPDWVLRAASIRLDNEEEVGQAKDAELSFMGVPILPVPALSFPLSEKRKSGVLPPTFGLDNVNGLELTLPYYWNIAPNRDATFYPALMTKRGIDLSAEFRYLERDYSGTLRGAFMPADKLRGANRWGYSLKHDGKLDTGLPVLGALGLSLQFNRVSDDNYWRDFPRGIGSLTQRLLANDGSLNWSQGSFSASARALKWQTLQDPTAPITPPYDRLPQLAGRYARAGLPGGLDVSVDVDFTRFEADRLRTLQPNAGRAFVLGQVSRSWQAPGWFLVPKLQLHARHYDFDAPYANGLTEANSAVPTFSLDSGLIFERDTRLFGRSLRQTLEPRAFYVRTPFRDQNLLPVYDTAAKDFNFANIYTENAFVGNDRIADNNLLTLGATTRLLDPQTGAEAVRLGIAQRLRFADQQVTLPLDKPVSERLSDLLFGATINWSPSWSFDSTVQFNPKTHRSVRSTVGGRYSPGNYRVISAAYRLQRDASEQLDVGWQWPINDLWGDRGHDLGPGQGEGEGRWYGVGRMNYSLRDRKLVDALAGLEYDAGCWLGRIVLERLQSGTATATKRILFQLEFVGFTRLGSSALQTLKQNIPRYQFLRETSSPPSRFSHYD